MGPIEGAMGYIEPGHGKKGKQRELSDDEDLVQMYTLHKRKHDILLWCYGDVGEQASASTSKSRKRARSCERASLPPSKKDSITKTLSEVEAAVKLLKDMHGDTYPVEKLNAWAHLINIGKHDSYDEPPNYPFFKGNI